ncbi:MAG: hypothetical protein KDD34_09935, partial [Bdellovibrionales bacterium]|nr:hypothetical protein [Bdellovibrionales bacterium]
SGWISFRSTTYPDRTISTQTVISRNRNKSSTLTQNESETQSLSRVGGEIDKMIKSYHLKGSLDVLSQSSKSGFQDYSYIELMISLQRDF